MIPDGYTADDFGSGPLLVFYEVTRACDLVCRHCRACAQPKPHPKELARGQSRALLRQLAEFPKPPMLVITGGDPLKRGDVFELIAEADRLGLRVAITPSATPLVTLDALTRLREAGVQRIALSLDGADAATHDAVRGWNGSHRRTHQILREAQRVGLPVQINTTLTRGNAHQVDELAEQLAAVQIALWSVFFLVPVGRGRAETRLSAGQCERVFERLWRQARRGEYPVKTTEAPHYRRFVRQRQVDPLAPTSPNRSAHGSRAPVGTNDGRGVMFVSHTGQVFPSGFLPIECGRFPRDSVVETYRHAPLFQELRDPDQLKGKCGRCEYRDICGGSRARAYAVHRDPLAAEPDCAYMPECRPEGLSCSA